MTRKAILHSCLFLILLPLGGCSSSKKQDDQTPNEAERQRIEKEYQENLKKLQELTGGTKDTLDGKKPVPKGTPSAGRKTQPQEQK